MCTSPLCPWILISLLIFTQTGRSLGFVFFLNYHCSKITMRCLPSNSLSKLYIGKLVVSPSFSLKILRESVFWILDASWMPRVSPGSAGYLLSDVVASLEVPVGPQENAVRATKAYEGCRWTARWRSTQGRDQEGPERRNLCPVWYPTSMWTCSPANRGSSPKPVV